jgi:E3 ubiquitin-protein ligase HUWE1
LEALPDDMRQDVINQHMREQSSAIQEIRGESQLLPEFLNALPEEMRQEVLVQERFERELRQQRGVLESLIRGVGEPSAAEKREKEKVDKTMVKESINLMDSSGLSSLLRLIFLPEPVSKQQLDQIFISVCENTKSRNELLNMLMGILTNDANSLIAIDRNFSFLTLNQKVDSMQSLVTQRTLETLSVMCKQVQSVGKYFLTDSDQMKTPKGKKGKGKLHRFSPVVTLLNLLESELFLQNPLVLEQLIDLLATVLRPLAHIAKKKYAQKPVEEGEPSKSHLETPSKASIVTSNEKLMETPGKEGKEKHDIKLPVLPEKSVRAIVNILKDSVCSNKTFQFTLSVIQYLSSYPENLNTIIRELLKSAQGLCETLIKEVEELYVVLKQTKGTIQAEALLPFSNSASTQAKLLWILKTIDFLISSKHGFPFCYEYLKFLPIRKDLLDKVLDDSLKMEALKDLYEGLDLGLLWQKLGNCMQVINERDDLIHVATVMLPFIEGYMVISKPFVTILKKAKPSQQHSQKEFMKQRTTSELVEDGSFVVFAEANKKVLNAMVRNNPSLMNGSFSLLVQNPKVLEFDNKRSYFNLQLHKNTNRNSHSQININVRRKYVFEESYQQMQGKTGDAIKYGKINVRFRDEEGVDAGGVTREWFSALGMQMFNPDYALFRPSAADKVTYQPNRASGINPDHLFYFKFVGRIIGKAIYDNRLLDAYFTRSFYKCILNTPVDHKDMEAIDPEFYKSLDWMLHNDITDVLDLTFSMDFDDFGVQKVVDLKPEGRTIAVTEENKAEYIRLISEQKLVTAIKDQIQAFLSGFHEIIPSDLISIFNENELELLISGLPDIDIDDWKNNTEYTNYIPSSPQVQWFWRAVRSFSQEERAKIIQFATGTSKVPLGGFAQLQGSTGVQKFQIHKEFSGNSRLPSAHTW